MSLHQLFLNEINESLAGYSNSGETQFLQQEDLAGLPIGISNYLGSCGYVGKPKYESIFIKYEHATIKLKPDKNWFKITCQQFNAAHPPTRLALMKGRILGLLPLEARDKYQNGHGNMLVKLAGVPLSNAKGKEMDISALVTFLAEAPLLPTAFLSHTIKWSATESKNRIHASITDRGKMVSGEFLLNGQSQIIRFTTHDRYYSENGKRYTKQNWTAIYDRYQELNGVSVPTVIRAVWHLSNGREYEYFRAVIRKIKYNPDSLEETL